MRRAARIDENQSQIVSELRQMGMSVHSLAAMGAGFPDIVVGWRGVNGLFEVKNPTKPKRDRSLRTGQVAFIQGWAGQCAVVHTTEQVVAEMIRLTGGTR